MEALLAADASTWSKPRIRACEMALVTVLTRDDHGLDEDASNKTGEEWRVLKFGDIIFKACLLMD